MKTLTRSVMVATALLAGVCVGEAADEQHSCLEPGANVSYSITFEGQDGVKVDRVIGLLSIRAAVEPSQTNFNSNLVGEWTTRDKDGAFHIKIEIPKDAASGEYWPVFEVHAVAGGDRYQNQVDFQTKAVRVCNSAKFNRPKIIVLPGKP